jgi:hypothetical protein
MIHPHTARNNILSQSTRIPTIASLFDEHALAGERFLRPVIGLVDQLVRKYAARATICSTPFTCWAHGISSCDSPTIGRRSR